MSDDQRPAAPPISICHPDCELDPSECRITRQSSVTLLAWEPVFDGAGNPINQDPNTFVQGFQCTTCGREWQREITGSQSTIKNIGGE